MILEGLLTTINEDGSPHLAPMGPVVDRELLSWQLRPFKSSTTFANLQRCGVCVFHVTDDVLLVVQAALNKLRDVANSENYLPGPEGTWILGTACHWYRLSIERWDLSTDRAEAFAKVEQHGAIRPFWGWNRAKHAVLEATILATRVHLTGKQPILEAMVDLRLVMEKTAGDQEWQAWQMIADFLDEA